MSRPILQRGILVLVLAVLAVGGLWWLYQNRLALDKLAAYEQAMRSYRETNPVAVYTFATFAYVLVVAVSIPGAAVLTPLVGWYFGFLEGSLIASFASTAGATLAFLTSRYLLRDFVARRFADRLTKVDAALKREGVYYLLSVRMIPIFPFFVVNLVMGLTQMRAWTFWWVSQVGMLPATCLYVYAGSEFPTLDELANSSKPLVPWEVLGALAAVGLLPFGVKILLKQFRAEPPAPQEPSDS